jgi:hypothetical protein
MNSVKIAVFTAVISATAAVGFTAQAGAGWGLINDPTVLAKSAQMPVYAAGQANDPPPVASVVGPVSASVCTFQDDATVSKAAVVSQLRARAALKGANGIVGLRYAINSNTRSSCWHRGYTATGTAVVFN